MNASTNTVSKSGDQSRWFYRAMYHLRTIMRNKLSSIGFIITLFGTASFWRLSRSYSPGSAIDTGERNKN